jgi:hypothetical protein
VAPTVPHHTITESRKKKVDQPSKYYSIVAPGLVQQVVTASNLFPQITVRQDIEKKRKKEERTKFNTGVVASTAGLGGSLTAPPPGCPLPTSVSVP